MNNSIKARKPQKWVPMFIRSVILITTSVINTFMPENSKLSANRNLISVWKTNILRVFTSELAFGKNQSSSLLKGINMYKCLFED